MTIKVKLFWTWVSQGDGQESDRQIDTLEDEMNAFLAKLQEHQVKKIYVALGAGQRMGLIEYKENTTELTPQI